jgi:2-polyprenyl-3-methyl-5-hydroxy-6-metoxy-1,4-benzoquinol methylase
MTKDEYIVDFVQTFQKLFPEDAVMVLSTKEDMAQIQMMTNIRDQYIEDFLERLTHNTKVQNEQRIPPPSDNH